MSSKIILIGLVWFLSICHLNGQNTNRLIYSEVLGDTIEYLYQKIGDFEKGDSLLNVLILLDGDEYFGLASDVIRLYEYDDKISNTIVIGLPSTIKSRWKYYTPTKAEAYENSDEETIQLFNSSGEFDKYSNFIKTELMVKIEKELGQAISSNTIFGHSMGGLGALSFLVHQSDLFDNYIVASPSLIWDNHYILEKLDKELEAGETPYTFKTLSLSIAEEDMTNYESSLTYFKEYITKLSKDKESKVLHHKYENETHMTVGLRSLFDGVLKTMLLK